MSGTFGRVVACVAVLWAALQFGCGPGSDGNPPPDNGNAAAGPRDRGPITGTYIVDMKTSMGDIVLELDGDKAPGTVENFLKYADSGFYNGLVFHRVKPEFVIQGGGFSVGLERMETRAPIMNEADNGLTNAKGAIAMARTDQPHSATSQFYINLMANHDLDHRDTTTSGWGYAVFGRVIDGMDVVERIGRVETAGNQVFPADCPVIPVVIESVSVRERSEAATSRAAD